MKSLSCIFLLFIFGGVNASREVSLDLTGYVDPVVNIERIDDNGKTLDIFSRVESRFRVTSNDGENVIVTFKAENDWRLLHKDDPKKFIPFEASFKGNNKSQVVNQDSSSVTIEKSDFVEQEYEFGVIFGPTERIKSLESGNYSGRVTISVSSSN